MQIQFYGSEIVRFIKIHKILERETPKKVIVRIMNSW